MEGVERMLQGDAMSADDCRLLIESVEDYAIFMLDPDGYVTTWNRGAEVIKGFRAHEIIGKHMAAFYPEEDILSGKPLRELERARTLGRIDDEGYRVRKDGTLFWANVTITAVRDQNGALRGFAKVTRDLTQRMHAEAIARELAREQSARAAAQEAEVLVRESEERYRALSHRLEVILEGVADGILVQERSGNIVFANTAGARACGFDTPAQMMSATTQEVITGFELLDEHGAPIGRETLPAQRALRGEQSASTLMQVRSKLTGRESWSHVRATSVLDQAGLPDIAISIWHDVTETRKRELHERYLAQAATALSASLDYNVMLSTLASLLVPELADWCAVHLLDGEELQQVAVAHVDAEKAAFAREVERRYPPRRKQPGVWNVVSTGKSELYEDISEQQLIDSARDEEHLRILRAAGLRSALIVPIAVRDRVIGTISLVSAQGGRRYDASDLLLGEELGRRAASSIENARLYLAERKARNQVSLLARAGESFSAASDYEEMLGRVVDVALPALGDFAFLDVVEGGEVRRTAAAFDDPEIDALIKTTRWIRSERTDLNLCALSSGKPGFHPIIDDAWLQNVAASPEHLTPLRKIGLVSMVTVPLRARGEVLGALTLCFGESGRHHTRDDLKLAEELARRAAIAVVQVRLYAHAQEAARLAEQAARRAEEANRVKDEFLATVSHELRTPLNAILGWSSLLRTRGPDASVAKGIEVIHRNALAQTKIIEDILDVSRIITGKLRLDLKLSDLVAVVRDAIEVIRPSADAKRLLVELKAEREASTLVADAERLQQVVWNLLSNAVKFCEPNGHITVTIRHEGPSLMLSVHDTGQGIDPEFLPFVFDRFKQADGSTTRRVGGLGLGLAIVRHLVELHGGQVQALSEGLGRGATFHVSLPLRAVTSASEEPKLAALHAQERESSVPRGALAGKRVLVVDDERDARELLQTVLAEAGAVVQTAPSAAEAFAAIQSFRPDVLVSDIGMPDEDGYSLIQRVSSLDSSAGGGIPSIAVTAYTRGQDKTKALALGFTTHIGKPVNGDDLVAAVANLAIFARK